MPDLFLIECRMLNGARYFNERDTDRMGWSNTIDDIRSGQVENVLRVIRLNVEEGTARDVSEDAALEVIHLIAGGQYDIPQGSLYDFLETHAANALYELEGERMTPADRDTYNAQHRSELERA